MPSVRSRPIVATFANQLLGSDMPRLPATRRAEAVAFVSRRVDELPGVTGIGVRVIARVYALVRTLPGGITASRVLASRPIPVLGDYPRLVRSLAYAYIWESWPETRPDGAPG